MTGASLDPADHNWERELERGGSGLMLPDCRLKPIERERVRYQHGRLMLDQVYCAGCAKPFGGVPPNTPHIFYICDECVLIKGPPPECLEVKDARG